MEQLLHNLPHPKDPHSRVLSSRHAHEDAFILAPLPAGMALVQSVDILSPIGNNPRLFGQTAAANALSDIYAMGGEAYSAMNILSYPACSTPVDVLREILLGATEKLEEAGAVGAGGHTLEDSHLKFGLSVTGYVDPQNFARNNGLNEGDILILTKPIGTGILATGIKAKWEYYQEAEDELYRYTTALNKNAAHVLRAMKLKAATDITGFGLGGHSLEMAEASEKTIRLYTKEIPLMAYVYDYASNGLIPEASYINKRYAQQKFQAQVGVDELMTAIIFDAQSSGGLLLAVPKIQRQEALQRLDDLGEQAYEVGEVCAFSSQNLILE